MRRLPTTFLLDQANALYEYASIVNPTKFHDQTRKRKAKEKAKGMENVRKQKIHKAARKFKSLR